MDDVDTTKRKIAAEDLTYMEIGGNTRANTLDYWLAGRMTRTGDRHVTAPDAETETGSDGSSLSVGRLCTVDVVTTRVNNESISSRKRKRHSSRPRGAKRSR